MKFSFREAPGRGAIPFVPSPGEEAVQKRDQGRENDEGPDRSARLEEDERDEGGAGRDERAEEEPGRPGVGRRLGIADHEEGEEEERPALELMKRDGPGLPEPG